MVRKACRSTGKSLCPTEPVLCQGNRRIPVSFLETGNFAAQHGDRRFRQSECRLRIGYDAGGDGWIVGIGMAVRTVVDPHILLAAESHKGDATREGRLSLHLG